MASSEAANGSKAPAPERPLPPPRKALYSRPKHDVEVRDHCVGYFVWRLRRFAHKSASASRTTAARNWAQLSLPCRACLREAASERATQGQQLTHRGRDYRPARSSRLILPAKSSSSTSVVSSTRATIP